MHVIYIDQFDLLSTLSGGATFLQTRKLRHKEVK